MPSAPVLATSTANLDDPQVYEDEHVHAIYDEIASHFASTRYKPWPIIARFISSLPAGWVGLDSGTGNGKYLPLPLDHPGCIWTIGVDRSRNLLDIARTAGGGNAIREVVWGNILEQPWRHGAFDYAISIATIHHLSTADRRKLAVQRIIQGISPSHGRALIYVWAIDQDDLSKRNIPTGAASLLESQGIDVFVPWVLATGTKPKLDRRHADSALAQDDSNPAESRSKVFNRYYHMFAQGELTQLVQDAAKELGLEVGPKPEAPLLPSERKGVHIVGDGWERSNYYVEFSRWACVQC